MAIKKRLVFRLMVGTVPDNEETKNLRLADLVHHKDFDTREFTGVEPDEDYRLGEVMDGMLSMATVLIREGVLMSPLAINQTKLKVMFMEFTVQDGGVVIGLDLKA
jgi:hypothetical protein